MSLTGKTAVVTGGVQGIGRAVADLLAGLGARVHILDRDLQVAEIEWSEQQPSVTLHSCDIADEAEVQLAAAKILESGPMHILVNNAGINLAPASVPETSTEHWDAIMAVNLRGLYLVSRAFIPHMADGGTIINIASILAIHGTSHCSAYSASKGAILSLTRAMARDHAPRLRVNCISPGAIQTAMFEEYLQRTPYPEQERKRIESLIPMGRLGVPADIARMVAFLCSDDANWITGANFVVDGGDSA